VTTTIKKADASNLERIGRRLILLGVLVWVVWLVVKFLGGRPPLEYFLPVHLLGVIPGSVLSRWSAISSWKRNNEARATINE
jgi:hypothetical protein